MNIKKGALLGVVAALALILLLVLGTDLARDRARIRDLETEIDTLEEEISALEAQTVDPDVYSDFARMEEVCSAMESKKQRLSDAMDEWTEL